MRQRLYLNLVALNNQSYEGDDIEVVVVDNGSNDDTSEMLKEFKLKYPMKLIRIEENRVLPMAGTRGLKKPKGISLFFMTATCWLLKIL